MKTDNQNNTEWILDQLELGNIIADEANVLMVRMERVREVTKLHRSVRKALNAAVKKGELGHMKKDGLKPEVYYHPNFKFLAIDLRNKTVSRAIEALKKVYC